MNATETRLMPTPAQQSAPPLIGTLWRLLVSAAVAWAVAAASAGPLG